MFVFGDPGIDGWDTVKISQAESVTSELSPVKSSSYPSCLPLGPCGCKISVYAQIEWSSNYDDVAVVN